MLGPPLVLGLVSFNAGRFGDEAPLGLIEDGGVTEVFVSRVEEDLPEVISPLDWDSLDCDSLDLKLALERRRRFLKNGMMAIQRKKKKKN